MNKTILITGASSGIGKSMADKFYEMGWTVVAAARREKLLKPKIYSKKNKNKFVPLKLDITKKNLVDAALYRVFKKYGFPKIIILNAGVNNPNDNKITNLKKIHDIYQVNFFGTLNCVDAVINLYREKQKSSQLVLVSSVAGYRGLPYAAAYCSSKSALISFAESIYHQCKLIGLHVRVINPGFIKTPLTDKNNFKMPMMISSETASNIIYKKILNTKSFEISLPKLFCIFMKVIKVMPYPLYFKLTSFLLKKL